LTDVTTPCVSSSESITTSVAVNATATNSATVDAAVNTTTAFCFAPFFDIPTLNMLPHVIAEGMAPNIQVTIHSVVVHDAR